jgi:hypothetical protein
MKRTSQARDLLQIGVRRAIITFAPYRDTPFRAGALPIRKLPRSKGRPPIGWRRLAIEMQHVEDHN